MARAHLDAEMIVAASVAQAFQALGERVPDMLLTAPLLAPAEESALGDYLRLIGPKGASVPALTIPLLGSPAGEQERGRLSSWRRERPKPTVAEACDPSDFAQQIVGYLKRSRDVIVVDAAPRVARVPAPPLEPPLPEPQALEPILEVEILEDPAVEEMTASEEAVAEVDLSPLLEPSADDEALVVEPELLAPEPEPIVFTTRREPEPVVFARVHEPEPVVVAPASLPVPAPVVFVPQPEPVAFAPTPVVEIEQPSAPVIPPPAPAAPVAALVPIAAAPAAVPTMVQQVIEVPTGNGTHVQAAVNVNVAVSVQVAAAVNVVATQPPRRPGKPKPIQEEWGFFDPGQCGFPALLARLDEIADKEDSDN